MNFLEKQIKNSIMVTKTYVNDNDLAIAQLPKTKIKVLRIEDLGLKEDSLYYKRIFFTKYSDIKYEDLVNGMVRDKYTDSEEFAILRKAINGNKAEYETYNAYVEDCKAQAKAFVQERNKIKPF